MENIKNEKKLRPTKKQKELLSFIEAYIQKHGYSPSYREIMSGLSYNSVATVSLHVNSLIKRGHLIKRDYSARSLELVDSGDPAKISTNSVAPSEEKWLVEKIEHAFRETESVSEELLAENLNNLYVLVGALRVLGLEAAAQSFGPRLSALKARLDA